MEHSQKTITLTNAQLERVTAGDIDPILLLAGHAMILDEKERSTIETLKTHWKAAVYSLILSTALIMEGYDAVIMGSFYGQPAFQRRFGVEQPDGRYIIPANWQTGIQNSITVGVLIGLCICGYCQERFGSRRTYMAGMIAMIGTIFIPVFSTSLGMLLAGSFLMGIPWGIFQTLTTAYATEICPVNLRGILASFVNMAWGIGIFLSSGVARAVLPIQSDLGWKLPFMLQWVWPIPLLIGAYLAPESPWWLVRKGRFEEAKGALVKAARKGFYEDKNLDGYLAFMKHTNDMEKAESAEGSYLECFKGTNLRRTEIMFGVWLVQNWGGQGVTSLTVLFFQQAGLSVVASFDLALALNSMFIIGTLVCWFLQPRFGRRTLYLYGLLTCAVLLLAVGIMACVEQSNGIRYTIGSFMILINFFYNTSYGPLCYTIAGELPSSRIRTRSLVMGRAVYSVCGIITGQLMPRMLDPAGWNLGAKTAFFWLGTNIICTTWCYFRLPETGGFSFAELDILFANKVPTRKFKKVKIQDDSHISEHLETSKEQLKMDEVDHLEHQSRTTTYMAE